MPKKPRQPVDQQQAPAQPEAKVPQDRQAPQPQEGNNREESRKDTISAHDHSQDADRHNKTRHVHSEK